MSRQILGQIEATAKARSEDAVDHRCGIGWYLVEEATTSTVKCCQDFWVEVGRC